MNKFRRLGLIDYNGHIEIHSKHPVRTAGGSGQAASLAALGFQFQGRS
jgi:hypothetical protein